jgi:threonine/homoserine/homoserine lactone efflux protein
MIDPIQFAFAVAILLATPGPTNTLLLAAGSTEGYRALRLLPAEVMGYLTTILLVGYLVGGWLATGSDLALALRAIVAAYLLWLALRLWRRQDAGGTGASRLIGFRDVLVTTVLNPKALVFALAIIPLHDQRAPAYLAAFVGMVIAIGGAWIALGAALARGLVGRQGTSPLARLAALVIVGFAAWLLLPLWRAIAA